MSNDLPLDKRDAASARYQGGLDDNGRSCTPGSLHASAVCRGRTSQFYLNPHTRFAGASEGQGRHGHILRGVAYRFEEGDRFGSETPRRLAGGHLSQFADHVLLSDPARVTGLDEVTGLGPGGAPLIHHHVGAGHRCGRDLGH